jgi:hypothetical protein
MLTYEYLALGLVLGSAISLISYAIFGRCLLKRKNHCN